MALGLFPFLPLVHALAFGTAAGSTVSGFVLDARTGAPVAEARVELRRAGVATLSDSTGYFELGSREAGVDSLVVTHGDYVAGGLLLGDTGDAPLLLHVRIARRRSDIPDSDSARALRREAESLAARLGGHTWLPEDFLPHAGRAQHALQLLPFSGFVDGLEDRAGGACVRLAGGRTCAAIWVNGMPGSNVDLRTWFPGEVLAIVIVPPSRATLDSPPGTTNGVVAVFLQARGS